MATTTAPSHQYVLTSRQAADFLGISVQTLRNWRTLGTAPAAISYGGKKGAGVYYTVDSLREFVQAHAESEGAAK